MIRRYELQTGLRFRMLGRLRLDIAFEASIVLPSESDLPHGYSSTFDDTLWVPQMNSQVRNVRHAARHTYTTPAIIQLPSYQYSTCTSPTSPQRTRCTSLAHRSRPHSSRAESMISLRSGGVARCRTTSIAWLSSISTSPRFRWTANRRRRSGWRTTVATSHPECLWTTAPTAPKRLAAVRKRPDSIRNSQPLSTIAHQPHLSYIFPRVSPRACRKIDMSPLLLYSTSHPSLHFSRVAAAIPEAAVRLPPSSRRRTGCVLHVSCFTHLPHTLYPTSIPPSSILHPTIHTHVIPLLPSLRVCTVLSMN